MAGILGQKNLRIVSRNLGRNWFKSGMHGLSREGTLRNLEWIRQWGLPHDREISRRLRQEIRRLMKARPSVRTDIPLYLRHERTEWDDFRETEDFGKFRTAAVERLLEIRDYLKEENYD